MDREQELAVLEEQYRQPGASLFVLYGRRRVGKTELLRRFAASRRHVFFVADQAPRAALLADLSRRVWALEHPGVAEGFSFATWEAVFRFLGELAGRQPLLAVLDEVPYLVESDRAALSVLQRVWDEHLRHTQLKLVLCGSLVSFMERELLGYRSPLFGRRTGQLQLRPMTFRQACGFFPGRTPQWRVEAYAFAGGMPAYLALMAGEADLESWLLRHVLRPSGVLFEEPRFLLSQELREPAYYFSLLAAIAAGRTRLNEIAQAAHLPDRAAASRYLDVLRAMGLVEREVPVTEPSPERSRRGVYRIHDPFLRLWFRFIYPRRTELETAGPRWVLDHVIRPQWNDFVAAGFEEVARQHIREQAAAGTLPFVPTRIGRWWNRDAEVDVVALNPEEGHLLVGEAKWWSSPVGLNVLRELELAARRLVEHSGGLWKRPPRVHYALFSRSGFTGELVEHARRHDVLLVGPEEL
ncbi:MAG TPA: ATP-binding protein [Limnochordales bacterium]